MEHNSLIREQIVSLHADQTPPASAYKLTNQTPNPMKTTPIDFRRWQLHIRKACVNCSKPDHSETIKAWSVNWTLLGRILQAKNA